MKKITAQDKMMIVSAIIFGYLFYYQSIGVNYLIFTTLQIAIIAYISTKENRTLKWWGVLIGTFISAVSALLYGSLLSAFGSVFGLVMLSSITLNKNSSVVMTIFNTIYSSLAGILLLIKEKLEKLDEEKQEDAPSNTNKNALIFITTSVLGLIFFFLYRQSNVHFKEWTDKIDLSFISVGWIFFTLLGYYLIRTIYKPYSIEELQEYDLNAPNDLQLKGTEIDSLFISTQTKLQWGITLFITLNLLLFTVIITDFVYFFTEHKGEEINYSLQVHQGIDALIFSIILAIAIILYFFGGKLNFIKENKKLKQLAKFWIIQNAILVLLTAFRNIEYIQAFFLTYKRIGVFIYLACCLVGLFYTYIKISAVKTNWFLVRKVSWTIYVMLIWTPIVNWDSVIIHYNFNHAENNPKALDIFYLYSLPKVNHVMIEERIKQSKHVEMYQIQYDSCEDLELDYPRYSINTKYKDWRSFNFRAYENEK